MTGTRNDSSESDPDATGVKLAAIEPNGRRMFGSNGVVGVDGIKFGLLRSIGVIPAPLERNSWRMSASLTAALARLMGVCGTLDEGGAFALEAALVKDSMAAAKPSSNPEQNPALYSGLAFSTCAGKRMDPMANRAEGRGVAGSEGGNDCDEVADDDDGGRAADTAAPPASRDGSVALLVRDGAGRADESAANEGGGDAMKFCGNVAEPTCGLGRAENGAIARPRDSAEPGMLELLCEEVGLEE